MRRTITDWLDHARRATDSVEVEACVLAAMKQAASCHDWRAILLGIAAMALAPRGRVTEAASRTLDAAKAERDVWGFRDVARIRCDLLRDEAGARCALEAGAETLRTVLVRGEPPRGYEWVLLAEGFADTLADAEGVRACLEAGRDAARTEENADDLCSVGLAWAKHIDRETGAALVEEAESRTTRAASPTMRAWTVANAWRSLGDTAKARRVLDRALASAGDATAALHVARAWRSHDDLDGAKRAVERARALAHGCADWLQIASAIASSTRDEGALRDAVTRAEASAERDEDRVRVASAWHRWLHDDEAANRVGPRGVRPEVLRRRATGTTTPEGSASALFDWLRARATRDVLERIARADYGTDAAANLAALRDLCDTGLVPRALEWVPREVLELTRWSEGESTDHLGRALSCVLLVLTARDPYELATNGAVLLESCLALGPEPTRAATQLFAWYAETLDPSVDRAEDEDPERAVALALLLVLRAATNPEDQRVEALALALEREPSFAHGALTDSIATSLRATLWRALLSQHLEPLRTARPPVERVLRALLRRQ